MRLYSLDITPTRKRNTVTLARKKRRRQILCERELVAREADEEETNRRGRRPLISVGFFRFSFVCLFYISGKPFKFLLLFTRYVPASISRRSFIFLPYSSNEEHRYCCALLRKSVLVRSLRARFANSFVRVASSPARFRETNRMDGA